LGGVSEEAGKSGKVIWSQLDDKSPRGLVYLRFESHLGATAAIAALGGRSFGGKVIKAFFVPLEEFAKLFPAAVRVT